MTRHSIELKIVSQLKAAKRGQFSLIRARYIRLMQSLGYSQDEAHSAFNDVYDVAMLERGNR